MDAGLSTGKTEPSAEKKINHFVSLWIFKAKSAALLTLIGCMASASTAFAANPYLVRTFEENGRQIDEIIVPGRPPRH